MIRDRAFLWTVFCSVLSAVAVSVAGVLYTGHTSNENDRQWCDLLTTLDRAYSTVPPKTELGRQVATLIHRQAETFDCEVPE